MPLPPPSAPAARAPPRRPGAPRKAAAPTCSRPAVAAEKQPPARPPAPLSRSWPSASLRKTPARRGPGPGQPRAPAPAGSGHNPAGTADSGSGHQDAAARFPLSLSPEATLVLQRRHLQQPRRSLPSPSANARRWLGLGPRTKAGGPRRGGDPGVLDARPSCAPLLPRSLRVPDPSPRPANLRHVLKVSLLNDQHKYDDVEYEEGPVAVDEGLVQRCTEWLRGVESAAAARGRTRPLGALPHLSTL